MEFEDGLIIGVALVIGLNRAFIGTALKRSRAAYVFIQAFDVGASEWTAVPAVQPPSPLQPIPWKKPGEEGDDDDSAGDDDSADDDDSAEPAAK